MEKLRIIVMVDIPSTTRHERAVARAFGQELFERGFTSLQAGVYTRMVNGRERTAQYVRAIQDRAPECGTVRVFSMTDLQFSAGELIAGAEHAQEQEVDSQVDIFL